MDIQCTHCNHKLTIPDEKVPKGKAFAVPCPKCKKKFSVDPGASQSVPSPKSAAAPQKQAASVPAKQADPPPESGDDAADSSKKEGSEGAPANPFEFLEKGAKTAMVCESDPDQRAKIRGVLEAMDYHILEADNPRDALKQLRFHDFNLLILNEGFGTRDPDTNHVMKYLSQLNVQTRRLMFVALLSTRFRTGDNMQAFNKSVNVIINPKDMGRFDKILQRDITDYENFYKVFLDAFRKIKGF
jgi:CheY-like chemotaxis protein